MATAGTLQEAPTKRQMTPRGGMPRRVSCLSRLLERRAITPLSSYSVMSERATKTYTDIVNKVNKVPHKVSATKRPASPPRFSKIQLDTAPSTASKSCTIDTGSSAPHGVMPSTTAMRKSTAAKPSATNVRSARTGRAKTEDLTAAVAGGSNLIGRNVPLGSPSTNSFTSFSTPFLLVADT